MIDVLSRPAKPSLERRAYFAGVVKDAKSSAPALISECCSKRRGAIRNIEQMLLKGLPLILFGVFFGVGVKWRALINRHDGAFLSKTC